MLEPASIPLHWAHRLSFLSRRHLAEAFSQAGHPVSAEEWAVLVYLWGEDGKGPADIADHTIRDRTTVTRLLDGMERKGFVLRRPHPDDRRRSQVCLTDAGQGLQDQLVPIAQAHMAVAFCGVPQEELEMATRVLRRMTENLMAADAAR